VSVCVSVCVCACMGHACVCAWGVYMSTVGSHAQCWLKPPWLWAHRVLYELSLRYQMEVDRVRYLLASYHRVRLAKVWVACLIAVHCRADWLHGDGVAVAAVVMYPCA
jgi:hypothetical protein